MHGKNITHLFLGSSNILFKVFVRLGQQFLYTSINIEHSTCGLKKGFLFLSYLFLIVFIKLSWVFLNKVFELKYQVINGGLLAPFSPNPIKLYPPPPFFLLLRLHQISSEQYCIFQTYDLQVSRLMPYPLCYTLSQYIIN